MREEVLRVRYVCVNGEWADVSKLREIISNTGIRRTATTNFGVTIREEVLRVRYVCINGECMDVSKLREIISNTILV